MTYAAPPRLELIGLPGLPLINAGDALSPLLDAALRAANLSLQAGDVLVLAQKIISKAEGRRVALASVTPSRRARALAQRTGKDPRMVELILRESREVVRVGREVLIVEHRSGFVLANAGIDQSNVNESGDDGHALLLPVDPDASAARLRTELAALTGVACGVLIIDSIGRAWRRGTVGQAIGAAGLPVVVDARGRADLFGRELRRTDIGVADEIAAAASLLMGQANEGRPAVLVRGFGAADAGQGARVLQRDRREDLFR
jgi:coenzyme F420-0:L-glutamate ligase / coenzyme F420-1:gamma-L-glutamate ligase